MAKTNPKLMIIDYYDLLIRHVDIYTEEQLAKYTKIENNVLFKDVKENQADPKELKIPSENKTDLLNRKRDELIDKLREYQKDTLDYYETIKNELKVLDK